MRHLSTSGSIGWEYSPGYFFHGWVGAVQKVLNARPKSGPILFGWSCGIGARRAIVIILIAAGAVSGLESRYEL